MSKYNNSSFISLVLLLISFFGYASASYAQTEPPQKPLKMLFIVNSISHKLKKVNIEEIIATNIDKSKYNYHLTYTKGPNHAFEIAKQAVTEGIDIVVSVGGDGTLNEVAKGMLGSKTALAIIPAGSGNGLARHLGISTNIAKAVGQLNTSQPIIMDTATINDKIFLGTAGIGFDAHIAWVFDTYGKRGLSSYLQLVMREYYSYKNQIYPMVVDGIPMQKNAFIVSFANGSQYGNNIHIAPKANIQDGYLELVIVKEIPFYAIGDVVYRVKHNTIDKSKYVETIRCKDVVITKPYFKAHIDGEPVEFTDQIKVKIQPATLKIMVPQ